MAYIKEKFADHLAKLKQLSACVFCLVTVMNAVADPLVFNNEEEFIAAVAKAQQVIRDRENKKLFTEVKTGYAKLSAKSGDRLVYGNPQSRYIVTEYSDIECPACRYYYPYTKQLVDKYPDEIALEFKHFPLEFHGEKAIEEAKSAICVGNLRGSAAEFAVIDVLFAKTRSNGDGSELKPSDIAKAFDIDVDDFNRCLLAPETESLLQESIAAGFKAQINGTPTLVFTDTKTGKNFMTGGGNLQFLDEQLKQLKEQK